MIDIKGTERVLFAGKTGSGKTFAATAFLSQLPRIVVYDPLLRTDYDETTLDEARKLAKGDKWVVCFTEVEDFADFVFENFDEGGFVVYIDELYVICPPRGAIHPVVTALWTRGRANNIGAWAAFQRPKFIPLFVLSESEHYFCFRLSLEDDRKAMSQAMGKQVLEIRKDEHGFWYHDIRTDVVKYYPQLRVKAQDVNVSGDTE